MSDSDEFRLDSDSVSASENEGDRPARRKGASSPKKSVSKLPAKRTPKRKAEDDAGDDGREGDASGTEDAAAGEDKLPGGVLKLTGSAPSKTLSFLVETSDGEMNLTGDIGCIGRVLVDAHNPTGVTLDLKGLLLKGALVDTNSYLVLKERKGEIRVSSVVNRYFQYENAGDGVHQVLEGVFDEMDLTINDEQHGESDAEGASGSQKKKKGARKAPKVVSSVEMTGSSKANVVSAKKRTAKKHKAHAKK